MDGDIYHIVMHHEEGFSIIDRRMTDIEAEFLSSVINQLNANRSDKYAPSITMTNISLNKREEERHKNEEAAIADQMKLEDLKKNGPITQAFNKAIEKKNR